MKQLIVPLKKLQRLRNFKGGKQQFWDLFLDLTAVISGADSGVIAMRDNSGEWRTVSYFPKGAGAGGYIKIFLDHMDELNDTARKKSRAVLQKQDYTLIAIPVMIDAQGTECLTVFYLKKFPFRKLFNLTKWDTTTYF